MRMSGCAYEEDLEAWIGDVQVSAALALLIREGKVHSTNDDKVLASPGLCLIPDDETTFSTTSHR